MLTIILYVCLIADPQCENDKTKWKDVNLSIIEENLTPFKLMHYGQYEAKKWIVEHPEYKIMKISAIRNKFTKA